MSQVNPLLQSYEPVYIKVELPSKGFPYNDNHPDIFEENTLNVGAVQIRSLTTKDELLWTDEYLTEELKTPMIILQNVVLGLKKPELLIRADVEFLLLQSRILTYGKMTTISWTCSECKTSNEQSIDYNTLPIKTLENIDDLTFKHKNFEITMTPLIFQESIDIQKANDDEVSEQLDKIVSCIQKVNVINNGNNQEVIDKGFIAQWIEEMNPKDFKIIIDNFTNINDIGAMLDVNVKCSKCGLKEETEVVVDLTNFFSEED